MPKWTWLRRSRDAYDHFDRAWSLGGWVRWAAETWLGKTLVGSVMSVAAVVLAWLDSAPWWQLLLAALGAFVLVAGGLTVVAKFFEIVSRRRIERSVDRVAPSTSLALPTSPNGKEARARLALTNRLGELRADLNEVKTLQDAERWERPARDVIREALGPGREQEFRDRGPEMDDRRRDFLNRFVTERQARLAELMKRIDHLPLEPAFVERVAAGDDRQSRVDVEPDMTMREALYRLVGVIKPKALAPDLNHVSLESWRAAALALREAAYKGDIRVWGRQQLSRPQDGYADLLVAIEPEYWRRARLNRFACVHPEVASVCRSEVEPGVIGATDDPPPVYGYLCVNRAQIERLWPKPGTFL